MVGIKNSRSDRPLQMHGSRATTQQVADTPAGAAGTRGDSAVSTKQMESRRTGRFLLQCSCPGKQRLGQDRSRASGGPRPQKEPEPALGELTPVAPPK